MSRVSKKITNWLYTVLQPQYTHTELTYRDIYRFLSVYLEQGFKIRTAVYTSASGGSDLLVNLYGPLTCGNNTVHINVWVPLNYPYADVSRQVSHNDANGVPIVYVVPPKGHIVRPGNNVDSQGQVYHPFLAQWYNSMALGKPSEQFDLLILMECLKSTFERTSPVVLAPQTTGPALPPKPSSGIVSPQQTGSREMATGPPLPQKLASYDEQPNPIPQKYRAPPPLPSQITPNQWGQIDTRGTQAIQGQASQNQSVNAHAHIPLAKVNGIDHNWPKDIHQGLSQLPNSTEQNHTTNSAKPRRKPPTENKGEAPSIEDLMDQVTLESTKENSNPYELQRIAQHINRYLDPENPEGLNNTLPRINETRNKTSALHFQLMHHNNQAKANIVNLDNHVQYLTTQVDCVGKLNKQLHELAEANKQSEDEVFLNASGDRKIPLDDLVIPDSMLVRQLYDTVAEIEGYKDAIKLVGGTYKSEPELINDDNLDSCIRSVRALSRELFWLEVTRDEIGRVMGLQM
ncbi:hypothetical protein JCM33374_g84 [Metschnikowia sp. JCM 33374]|nr:hypothetical protein JCM33374_g84 [Metschnikowia sp. JCM 33374]